MLYEWEGVCLFSLTYASSERLHKSLRTNCVALLLSNEFPSVFVCLLFSLQEIKQLILVFINDNQLCIRSVTYWVHTA